MKLYHPMEHPQAKKSNPLVITQFIIGIVHLTEYSSLFSKNLSFIILQQPKRYSLIKAKPPFYLIETDTIEL
jgi:hypothetical protein